MKSVAIALTVFLFTSAAQASTAIQKFVAVDNSAASNLCVIAAKDGFKAAVDHAIQQGEKNIQVMVCNGKSIQRFSKSFQAATTSDYVISKEILVVPANNSFESNLCANAVKNGLKAVSLNTDIDVSQTICNGQQIAHFVKRYSNF